MKICIFCNHDVSQDALVCPNCKEYKGLVGEEDYYSGFFDDYFGEEENPYKMALDNQEEEEDDE